MKFINNLFKKFDMPSKHKIWTIVCASLLVVAIVITAIFSMNTSTDFAEHNVISVKPFDADFNQNYAQHVQSVDDIMIENGVKDYVILKLDAGQVNDNMNSDDISMGFVVKFADVMGADIDALREAIVDDLKVLYNEAYSVDENVIVSGRETAAYDFWEVVGQLFLGLGLALVVAYVYAAIRFGLLRALIVPATVVFNLIMSLAIILLARITVYYSFVYIIAGIFLMSAFYSVYMLYAVKSAKKEYDIDNKYTPDAILNKYLDKTYNTITICGAIAIVILMAVFAINMAIPEIVAVVLSTFVAMIVVGFATISIQPAILKAIEVKDYKTFN